MQKNDHLNDKNTKMRHCGTCKRCSAVKVSTEYDPSVQDDRCKNQSIRGRVLGFSANDLAVSLEHKRNWNHCGNVLVQPAHNPSRDKNALNNAIAPKTVLAILGFKRSYICFANSGKPAPNAERTTVEMASAEAANMRYASMI
jgi:hypothetical protein